MIGFVLLAVGLVAQCPTQNAHYVLRHTPEISARFRPVDSGPNWPSNLAFEVYDHKLGKVSWWLPWLGGTDNLQNIASTTDVTVRGWQPPDPDGGPRPQGNREYLGMDADYNVINDVPYRGKPAPVHILIPEAGSSHDQTFPAKQFFDLMSCSEADGSGTGAR